MRNSNLYFIKIVHHCRRAPRATLNLDPTVVSAVAVIVLSATYFWRANDIPRLNIWRISLIHSLSLLQNYLSATDTNLFKMFSARFRSRFQFVSRINSISIYKKTRLKSRKILSRTYLISLSRRKCYPFIKLINIRLKVCLDNIIIALCIKTALYTHLAYVM